MEAEEMRMRRPTASLSQRLPTVLANDSCNAWINLCCRALKARVNMHLD
jgi:hypothetical protein